jgi:tetrahydromethanopterin S-methyltransferase subunit G
MLSAVLQEMREGFASVNQRLDKVDGRLNKVDGRLDKVDERLGTLEAKQFETKPIWERALKEIADSRQEMRERFDDLEGRITVLSGDVVQIRSAILRLKREEEQHA